MTDALDAVIDGAIERALLGGDDARRYFALAGALDRGRSAARSDAVGPPEHDDPDRERPTERDRPTHVLGAALLSTVAVDALGSVRTTDIDPGAWSPGGRDVGARTELVAVGAVAACRRFDVEPETVAARSGVSPERLARYRENVTPGSEK
ncbi:hypothetical protein [Halobellus ruber]|uniref:Uncharacterized protein n=1 Tax=Halobellus ruber TaxID=2761102 RepID=A0A7J9SJY9_9EURY|nr:hypothetical protein [Halobellus ruber]MBB6646317.1 hypothetical protein [Halobellus ruber]